MTKAPPSPRRYRFRMLGDCWRWAAGLLVLAVSGCFYDSSWAQEKTSQKHEAARQAPPQLRAQSLDHGSRLAQRALRLRVYATPTYSATVVNWQKQFEDTLACANAVFSPEFGARFEVAEFIPFRPRADEEKLDGVLDELTERGNATDVDWVVGLATAVPRFAVSADDLGKARMLSDQFVMRAMSDAYEYEAIEDAFSELSENERRKLYHARKRHKLCSVFLHEVAHTLGVPHELGQSSLMNANYQVKAQGFSEEAAEVIRGALRLRANRPPVFLDVGFAQALNSSMTAAGADWEPASRDQILSDLANFRHSGAAISGAAPPAGAPAIVLAGPAPKVPPVPQPSTAGLSPDEQRSYQQARAELNAGHALAARQIAAPLLAKHAQLPAIQSLRCDIAMAVGGDWDTISGECGPVGPR